MLADPNKKQLCDANGALLKQQFYDPTTQEFQVGTTLGTLLTYEDQDRETARVVNGAGDTWPVPSGKVDYLVGVVGSAGDYIDHIDIYITDSTKSQVVVRQGTTTPVLSLTTHASTASSSTVINTATNPDAVLADQFRDCMLKIGNEYRRVLTHTAFAAGAVNAYTLDRALGSTPGTGVAFTIEDRRYVQELIPNNSSESPRQWDMRRRTGQAGWRFTTADGVRLVVVGDCE